MITHYLHISDVNKQVARQAHLELGVAQLPVTVHVHVGQPGLHLGQAVRTRTLQFLVKVLPASIVSGVQMSVYNRF